MTLYCSIIFCGDVRYPFRLGFQNVGFMKARRNTFNWRPSSWTYWAGESRRRWRHLFRWSASDHPTAHFWIGSFHQSSKSYRTHLSYYHLIIFSSDWHKNFQWSLQNKMQEWSLRHFTSVPSQPQYRGPSHMLSLHIVFVFRLVSDTIISLVIINQGRIIR